MMLAKLKEIYETKYKLLLVITLLILILSIGVLAFNKVQTGEFIKKDVSLKGGLLITIQTDKEFDIVQLEDSLSDELDVSVSVKKLHALGSAANIGYTITLEKVSNTETVKSAVEKVTGVTLAEGNFAIEEVSSGLGATFFDNTIKAILIAFILMSIVIIVYFRSLVPSAAIILAAVSDLTATMAVMSLFDIKLSIGGVAALLMLIGYSVDTDILLSTRMIKRAGEGTLTERIYSSIKTGLTMQLTAIAAISVLFFISPAAILKQIALILMIGLTFDILNTWIQNVGIMRWYLERKSGEEKKPFFKSLFAKKEEAKNERG